MNILILTTHLNTGGITSYLTTLTKGLLCRGHKVVIVASSGDRTEEFRDLGAYVITMDLQTKSELSPKVYSALGPLKKIIQEHNIDIIHSHTRITQVLGQILKRATKKPYVSTCHGFFQTRLSRKLYPAWGDKVIAISQPVLVHLKKDFQVPGRRIALIETGVDIDAIIPVTDEDRKTRRKEFGVTDEPIIGIIARLSDVKGQDILIKAMPEVIREFPRVRLLLFGTGKMEDMLKNLVQTLNLSTHITFFPIVNRTFEILPLFDVFVMPSRQEGLGLSVMEAQAAGLPVVASNIGGIPTLIKDNHTGFLVEPEKISPLARTLIAVLKDLDYAKIIGNRAKEFIRKNYSSARMITQTLGIYQEAIDQNEKNPHR